MSWLKGLTTLKGLSSSDQEMLAAIMKLNKIKSSSKNPAVSSNRAFVKLLLSSPVLSRFYSAYKEQQIKKDLSRIEKLYLRKEARDYHPVYLAAQKLSGIHQKLQLLRPHLASEKLAVYTRKIEVARETLIKQWRNLTTQRLVVSDKKPPVPGPNKSDDLSTTKILSSLKLAKDSTKRPTIRKLAANKIDNKEVLSYKKSTPPVKSSKKHKLFDATAVNNLTRNVGYLFFKDANSYQQFKSKAKANTQLTQLINALESQNQIKIGMSEWLDEENIQTPSEIISPFQQPRI